MSIIHPSLILISGSFLIPLLKGRIKYAYILLLSLAGILIVFSLPKGIHWTYHFLNYKIILGRVDSLSKIFCYVFSGILFLGLLYSLKVADDLQFISAICYGASALGVTLAGDFLSLYIFWEIMAVSSCFLILARRTETSKNAAFRYILVHVVGGLFLLAGIILYFIKNHSLEFSHIELNSFGSYLLFIGVALNGALFPLHPWLVDAYPEATGAGSVFLSAFTTKSAVYMMARTFAGAEILIWLGMCMIVIPMVYLVIENDIRRILSYSLLTQVGIMMAAIGIGTPMAIDGAVAHAFSHIIYKALLFMTAGSVLYMTGKIKCTELGGLYRFMPLTAIFCIIGACSISAVPFFNGYVSKSIVISSAEEEKLLLLCLVLHFACACVIHGVKAPYFMFFRTQKEYKDVKDPPFNMILAMGITSFLCIFFGIYPKILFKILPYPISYEPYSLSHTLPQLQLLIFGGLALCFLMLSGLYPSEIRAINLELDWFYRKGGKLLYKFFDKTLNKVNDFCESQTIKFISNCSEFIKELPIMAIMFFMVTYWMLIGVRDKTLEIKKIKLYNNLKEGVLPVGLGASFSIFFIVILFILCR